MDLSVFSQNEWILLLCILFISAILIYPFMKYTEKAEKKMNEDRIGDSGWAIVFALLLIDTLALACAIFWIPIIIIGNVFGFLPLT
jgi:hypothetical protein